MGGGVAGAFDGHRLVAFVFGVTGLYEGEMSHWSHMLGVRPGIRGGGLGFRLKAYQRERLMALGVRSVRWTFDPLEACNAHFNLSKVGIVVRQYVPDMYGESLSRLHRGMGTDRLVAGVPDRLVAGVPEAVGMEDRKGALPVPVLRPIPLGATTALVSIPVEVQALKKAEVALARRWREVTRQALMDLIRRGFEIRELVRGAPVSRYLLELRPGS